MLGEAMDRPAAGHVNGPISEVDGAGGGRRRAEREQHEDRQGWTKLAHTAPTIASAIRFGRDKSELHQLLRLTDREVDAVRVGAAARLRQA
jgi:hypothetical protein